MGSARFQVGNVFDAIERRTTHAGRRVALLCGRSIASGDWTATVANWSGRMIGPFPGPDGKMRASTGKSFRLEFCTVARWKDGEIVEEKLFYDQVGFLRQVGLL